MQFFPDPSTVLSVGGLDIQWYAVTMILGCIAGFLYTSKQMLANGYRQVTCDDLLAVLLITGLIGGRIFWVIENWHEYSMYAWYIFAIGDGGFELIGSALAMMLGIRWYTKRHQMSFRRTMDIVIIALLIVTIISKSGRAMGNPVTWISVAINIVELFILTYGVAPYKKGRRRGDVTAFGLMLMGISRLISLIFGLDILAIKGATACLLAEVVGLSMYAFNRNVPETKPVVLFDFDGTIMDSEHMVIGCFAYLFQKYGNIADFTEEVQREVFGPPLKDELQKLFPDQSAEKLMKEYRAFQKSLPGKHLVQVMPGALEMLQDLKKNGYVTGIVTSRLSESCEMWLEDLEIEDYFDIVVGTERYRHAKPAPDGIIRACDMLHTGHDSVLYIGDNVSDVQCGISAGVYTVGYVFNPQKKEKMVATQANDIIYDLRDLTKILESHHAWSYRKV